MIRKIDNQSNVNNGIENPLERSKVEEENLKDKMIRKIDSQSNVNNDIENPLKRFHVEGSIVLELNDEPDHKKMRENDDDSTANYSDEELSQYLTEEAEKNSQLVLERLNDFSAKARQKIQNFLNKKMLGSKAEFDQEQMKQQNVFDEQIMALEKGNLEWKNAFEDERKVLEQKIKDLETENLDQKKFFHEEKNALEQQITALKTEISGLMKDKGKCTCFGCGKLVNSMVFCDNHCNENNVQ